MPPPPDTALAAAPDLPGLAAPPHDLDPGPAFLCIGVLGLASLVRFDTPLGFTAQSS